MPQKVAFLDRDGVLNKEIGNYVCSLEEFEILDHALINTQKLIESNFELIVITNQGGISKELYSKETVHEIHQYMQKEFALRGVNFLEVLYCPHHSVNENCFCRKPKGLMIEKMIHKYQLNPDNCFLIGDNIRDVKAAHAANVSQAFEIKSNSDWFSVIEKLL